MLYFNVLERNKDQPLSSLNQTILAHPNLKSKSKGYQKWTLSDSMFSGHNLWVVKPNDFNRGRGVHIFKTLEQLKKLILEYTNRTEANPNQNGGQLFRTEPEN